jgi:hypothetical protein
MTRLPDDVFGQSMIHLDCQSLVQCSRVCTSWRAMMIDVPAIMQHYTWLHEQMRRLIDYPPGNCDIERFSGRVVKRLLSKVGSLQEAPGPERDWGQGWRSSTIAAVMGHLKAERWLAMRLALPTTPRASVDWFDVIVKALKQRAPEQHAGALITHYQPNYRMAVSSRAIRVAADWIIKTGDRSYLAVCCDLLRGARSDSLKLVGATIARHLETTQAVKKLAIEAP